MSTNVPLNNQQFNEAGISRDEYKGAPSTLCRGCGHSAIAAQIVSACFELSLIPEKVMKFSGIGCSSKSPTYFLGRSFSFNGLHGRMPSLALGAAFADTSIKCIGISGDGDSASIGIGQFKHLIRRNLPMTYIVENNGVYGLTKGQFSATSEQGLSLKRQGINSYSPIDICMEAIVSNATFVARSFAGDPKQLKELLKAAISHNGISIVDVISPCVTFHNQEQSIHSYTGGKEHEKPLHDISFIPAKEQITIDDYPAGETKRVTLFDGSSIILKKLNRDYDPADRWEAIRALEEANKNNWMLTGLIFIDSSKATFFDHYNLPDLALNRLPMSKLRPTKESLDLINASF